MSYQVIARRYRPTRFDEVVGQDAVAATLRSAILQDRLAHAYLFCGPRGVGKTSMARIFARALNCPAASDRSRPESERGIPCGSCDICQAVHTGDDIDVIEMDGASHRGIEDIRDIIENVKFTPSKSPYKIYLIDEVHMLTREAFNALLKILEEPPAHVKFLFATTEAHKIPDTVLSRCQRFDFHSIGEPGIVQRLRQICDNEKSSPEPGLLEKIARYCRGGLRDAQTLLDQLISFSEGTLRLEDLERITGRLPEERALALADAALENQPARVLEMLGEFFAAGSDPAIILEQLMDRFRFLLRQALESAPPGPPAEAGGRGGEGAGSGPAAGAGRIDRLIGSLQILHETAARLKGSPFPQLALEISLVKLARIEDLQSLDETIRLLRRLEAGAAPSPDARPVQAADPRPAPAAPGPRLLPPEEPPGPHRPAAGRGPTAADLKLADPAPAGSEPPAAAMPRSTAIPQAAVPPAAAMPRQAAMPREIGTPAGTGRLAPAGPSSPEQASSAASAPPGAASSAEELAAGMPEMPASAGAGPDDRGPSGNGPSRKAAPPEPAPEPGGTEPGGSEPPPDFARLRSLWDQVIIEFRQRSPELQAFLKNAAISDGGNGSVQIGFPGEFPYRQMSGSRRLQMLEKLILDVSGSRWKVRAELLKGVAPGTGVPGDGPPGGRGGRQAGEPSLRDNPLVKKSVELFRGRIL